MVAGLPGVDLHVIYQKDRAQCLEAKRCCPVGYDHLTRGVPSISTVENAFMRMGVLCGTQPEHRDYAHRELGGEQPWPAYSSLDGLRAEIIRLRDSTEQTRRLQENCYRWAQTTRNPVALARRLARHLIATRSGT